MILEIEVGGRRVAVEVRHAEAGWTVVLDGRTMHADWVPVGEGRWSLLLKDVEGRLAGAPARSCEIAIERRGNGERVVHVNGRAVPLALTDLRTTFGRKSGRVGAAARGSDHVVAPMPGRVVKVLVKPGDAVEAGQGLIVVEAMKMENELRAARAGVVSEVRAAEGKSVEANTILVVLE